MHLRCCSIITKFQIKVVELIVAHPRTLESLKKLEKWASYAYFNVGGSKTQQENSLITQQCMNIVLLMHEQMFNDPWLNIATLFTNIECIIKTNRKGHKNVHIWFQWTWLKIKINSINNDGGKRKQNPNLVTHSWPLPPPPMLMSMKILRMFPLFQDWAIVMLLVQLSN